MHSLIHTEYAKATAQRERPTRAVPPDHGRPHAPPGRLRAVIARGLTRAALRMHREATRRAVA